MTVWLCVWQNRQLCEGQLHGGACGRGSETTPCFSLHWPPALCQTEEAVWRVRKSLCFLSPIFSFHFYLSLNLSALSSHSLPILKNGPLQLSFTVLVLLSQIDLYYFHNLSLTSWLFRHVGPVCITSVLYNQISGYFCLDIKLFSLSPHVCLQEKPAVWLQVVHSSLRPPPSKRQKSLSPCLSHKPLMRSWMPLRSKSHPWGVRPRERGTEYFRQLFSLKFHGDDIICNNLWN